MLCKQLEEYIKELTSLHSETIFKEKGIFFSIMKLLQKNLRVSGQKHTKGYLQSISRKANGFNGIMFTLLYIFRGKFN